MVDPTQTLLTVSIPTLAVVLGILVNDSRLSDLRSHVDARFNAIDQRFRDMESLFTEKLLRVEQVMDARLRHLEDNR